ncbi:Scr1 family TA system antitoxin-like transcriptional regulator [Streptomyces sp. NPDC005202]|uniref:Scr1 family TA system antitoxin-like transcriptional regulator n=1 Tax=Streptomyces sp. NPDC005202 TaxID=3157021 RepID=UPI0033BC7F57
MSERRAAPTVGQVVLGRRLQELREAAGLKREEAARVLRVVPATVRRMEMAEVTLKIPYVQVLLTAYGVSDEEADAFLALAEEANQPGWWQRFHDVLPDWFSLYVSLEGAARLIRSYEPHFVPGLLQTEEYARAVLEAGTVGQTGPKTIERHVSLRMARQRLLEQEDPPHLWVIMDETVLRRPVSIHGEVMRDQLDKLLEYAERNRVTVQVAALAPGSHLILSQVTQDISPDGVAKAAELFRQSGTPFHPRTHAGFSRFFDGLELLEPGVVPVLQWRPEPEDTAAGAQGVVQVYAGVARKP